MSYIYLYQETEKSFRTNGIGILKDVISPIVKQELNGQYELSFKYPLKGAYSEEICENAWVTAKPDLATQRQKFRIFRISKPMEGKITVYARHIAYESRHICVAPFEAKSAREAFLHLKSGAFTQCDFEFWTDDETVGTMQSMVPATIWSLLGGTKGSVLDCFGGEYEFDNNLIRFWNHRGADHGVEIRYGKNMRDLQQERNIYDMYTGICPFWTNSEGKLVQLPEHILSGPGTYQENRIKPVDFSQEFQEKPSVEALRAAGRQYIKKHSIGVPEVSMTVKFVPLAQTEEYKDRAILEEVALGDTVKVTFPDQHVNASARVVAVEFNPQLDRYKSVTLGKVKASFSSSIANAFNELAEQKADLSKRPDQTAMQKAIGAATDWLTNGKGYKVERRDPAGNAVDTLYMDTPDVNTANNVLRIGQSGIGFSRSGVNGPYVSAWTVDGAFNADFIVSGTLNANLLRAGIITDKTKTNYWDLDTGKAEINFTDLKIQGVSPQEIADSAAKQAADGKMRVFGTQPVPPYDVNDLWVKGSAGGIMCCKTAKKEGDSYAVSDWVDASNYINAAQAGLIAQNKVNAQTQMDIFDKLTNNGKIKGIYIKNGQIYINASYIGTGILADPNRNTVIDLINGLVKILQGSINLGKGNFRVENTGEIYAILGQIGNMHLANDSIYNDSVSIQDGITLKSDYVGNAPIVNINPRFRTDRLSSLLDAANIELQSQCDCFCVTLPDSRHPGFSLPLLLYSKRSITGQSGGDEWTVFRDVDFMDHTLRYAVLDSNSCRFSRGYTGSVGTGTGYTLDFTNGILTDIY